MATNDIDEPGFFRQNRAGLIVTAAVLIGAGFLVFKFVQSSKSAPRRAPELVMIKLPPPPPPPTPPQQPTPEEKMLDQREEKFETQDEKPKDEPPKPPDEPPIGTGIKGDGSGDGFGLTGSTGNGFGGSGGSRFGWYAGQVQSKISEALRNNPRTRVAELSIRARIWLDASGRITRAQLTGSTGDPTLDAAIRDEVLTGLQLRESPPAEMPMPIVLQLKAKRSH
jgi:protein TonB